jgi:hypothetical protein
MKEATDEGDVISTWLLDVDDLIAFLHTQSTGKDHPTR